MFAGEYAVLWKRGGNSDDAVILYAETQKMADDDRIELKHDSEEDWTLVIRDVEPYDSSEYLCELTTDPAMSIRHVVQVLGRGYSFGAICSPSSVIEYACILVAPSVSIQPDQDPLVVAPNDTVQLACIPSGNPKPTVSWERVVSVLTRFSS